jgi:oxygen-independent coproporphyrinogen-3 oxidase
MDYFARQPDELTVAQRRGRLRRNFRGYSAHEQCDSIGSQVHENLSQNAVSLDDYHESLDRQRLPLMRGHQSSDDDLLRREIIQKLSCQFRIDTRQISDDWAIDYDDYFSNEMKLLRVMAKDGLINIADNKIRVLEPGRLLLHNICTVFDVYRRPE